MQLAEEVVAVSQAGTGRAGLHRAEAAGAQATKALPPTAAAVAGAQGLAAAAQRDGRQRDRLTDSALGAAG